MNFVFINAGIFQRLFEVLLLVTTLLRSSISSASIGLLTWLIPILKHVSQDASSVSIFLVRGVIYIRSNLTERINLGKNF